MSPSLIIALVCVFLMVTVLVGLLAHKGRQIVLAKRAEIQAQIDAPRQAQQALTDAREQARAHGRREMLRNWAWWAAGEAPAQTAEVADTALINRLIDQAPPMEATADQLRESLWLLSRATPGAKRIKREDDLLNRYWMVAARVHYLTEGEGFDPARGISNAEYLSHDDPGIREAYIAGGKEAMDKIRVLVVTARDRERLYRSSVNAVDALARDHKAGLEALFQETGHANASDQWEAEAEALGGLDAGAKELPKP